MRGDATSGTPVPQSPLCPWSRMAEPDPIAPDPAAAETAGTALSRRGGGWWKVALAAAALLALFFAGRQLSGIVSEAARRIEELGSWAPLAFVAAYALAAVALVPGSVLTLAGGAIF